MKEELSLKRCLKALEEQIAQGTVGAVDGYLKLLERVEKPTPTTPVDGLMGRIGELEARVTFLEKLQKVRVI